jgi:putative phage-type endonuclease
MSLSPEDMKKVGGSDVAAIAGVNPYASAYAVWERIVHGVDGGASAYADRGRRLEPVVLQWYADTTGRRTQKGIIMRDGGRPHLRASIDAVSWGPGPSDDVARVVEAKTAGASVAHLWGDDGTDAIPAQYLAQTQWYMGHGRRTGFAEDDRADVPALVAGDFRLYVVHFDAEAYGLLSEAVDRFWVDHVLTGRPPDVTALPNDLEAIKRRFPRHETSEHLDFNSLPPDGQALLAEYLRAHAEQAAATDRLALWETRAKLLVGAAPGVNGLPEESGWKRIDWRQNKPGTATDWKAVLAALDDEDPAFAARMRALVKQHTKATEGNRPFAPRAISKGKR